MSSVRAGIRRDESESPERIGGSSSSSKHLKRSKVTAVACQPCQKRKSKCDGARPICSSCIQKGRTDCVYDSAADLRRTSALKQRIDALQAENADLRDIILSICGAWRSNNLEQVLRLTEQTFGENNPSEIAELAQVLRNSSEQPSLRSDPYLQQDDLLQTTQYSSYQPMAYGYMGGHNEPMMLDAMHHPSQPAPSQQDWSGESQVSSQAQEEDVVHQQRYPGSYMYPQ